MSQSVGVFDSLIQSASVLAGACALYRTGLIYYSPHNLTIYTEKEWLDGVQISTMGFIYTPKIDYRKYTFNRAENPFIIIPEKERAIAEYIRHDRHCDEGYLIEALQSYLALVEQGKGSIDKLVTVGKEFGVQEETMRYWVKEAEEDTEV